MFSRLAELGRRLTAERRLMDLSAAFFALLVYVATMAPTITWRNQGADSADLVAAAYVRGVPHPPGYPLYTLVSAVVVQFPMGDPAHRIAFLSGFAAAAAVFLLARALRKELVSFGDRGAWPWIPTFVALGLAFSPLFWSQATIPEVYAFNSVLVGLLLIAWLSESQNRLTLAAGALGVGIVHHLTLLFFGPGSLVLLLRRGLRRQTLFVAFAVFVTPLLLYLYLPLSALSDPPVNWGNPSTIQGLTWMVSAAAYRSYLSSVSLAEAVGRLSAAGKLLFQNFGIWGVAAGLWGFVRMSTAKRDTSRRLQVVLTLTFLGISSFAVMYNSRDSFLYLLPALMIFTVWIAYGIADLAALVSPRWQRGLIVILALFPLINLVGNYETMDLSRDREAISYAEGVFQVLPDRSTLIADGDEHFFALEYYRDVVMAGHSNVVVVSSGLVQFDWYYDQVMRKLGSPTAREGAPAIQDRLRSIVDVSQGSGRRIYSTVMDGSLGEFSAESIDGLYQIKSR